MKWLIRSGIFACVAAGVALTMAATLLLVTVLVQLNALGAFREVGQWFEALGTWFQGNGIGWLMLGGFVLVVLFALVADHRNKHLRRKFPGGDVGLN